MNIQTAQSFLCAALRCGTLDLNLLDDIEYDWEDVLERIDWDNYGFNDVIRAVFDLGIIDIRDDVENRLFELNNFDHRTEEEEEELEALLKLDPDNDFLSYHNYLDTSIWCEQHGDIYHKYMQEALDTFEMRTGFQIEVNV